jgi:hypothetical protein
MGADYGDYLCTEYADELGFDSAICNAAGKCVFTYSECVFSSDCATNLCRDGKCYTCNSNPENTQYDCSYADTEEPVDSAECVA